METTHQPVHDPFTGKPPQGMRMLFGAMRVDDKIRYCERLLDEGHEERIEWLKHKLKTANKNEWWYAGPIDDTALHASQSGGD